MPETRSKVLRIDPQAPNPEAIARAASVVRSGGLVAFPTETVYGLGANGLDAAAVARIYTAKGRPARNPIILHIASIPDAVRLVSQWTPTAELLAQHFWPGPLTLVLPRSERVPDIVTAGGPTVAIRWPTHPIAQALIRAADVPIAAPSANRSGELSPTCAEHVLRSLDGRIDLLIDGGPTTAGIESTVIDLSSDQPRLLRPGPISPAAMETLVGPLIRTVATSDQEALLSPGMLDRHYAPKTPLECFGDSRSLSVRIGELERLGRRIAVVYWEESAERSDWIASVQMPNDPVQYAARLYRVLHELDQMNPDRILLQLPPATEAWLAVRDRLRRASVAFE